MVEAEHQEHVGCSQRLSWLHEEPFLLLSPNPSTPSRHLDQLYSEVDLDRYLMVALSLIVLVPGARRVRGLEVVEVEVREQTIHAVQA